MNDVIAALRLRLHSTADQAARLAALLGDDVPLDLSPVQQARALLVSDQILRRLERLSDRIGAAIDPGAVEPLGLTSFEYEPQGDK